MSRWSEEVLPMISRIRGLMDERMPNDVGYYAKSNVLSLSIKWQDLSLLMGRLEKLETIIVGRDAWTYESIMPHVRDQLSWTGYLLEVENGKA